MIQTVKIKYGFRNATDGQIVKGATAVLAGMSGNAAFADSPVSMEVLQKAIDEFIAAIGAAQLGGRAATAEKKQKRHELMNLLRKLGHFVQDHSHNNEGTLRSSGFIPQNPNRTRATLTRPSILKLDFGMSTQLKLRVTPIPNAKGYEVRFAPNAADGTVGAWQIAGFFTNSRLIELNGLTPRTVYSVQVRALGGTAGSTDWSDMVRHVVI